MSLYNYELGTKLQTRFDQSEHKVYQSCSVYYQNQYWIFGGQYDLRTVSVVQNCGIKRQSIALPERGIKK